MREAYGYIRVSGVGQVRKDGPERQRQAMVEYAQANDITIVQWFEEPGITGACYEATLENPTADLDNRPAFQELLLALKPKTVQLVLIERLERLARSIMLQELILSDWRQKKVECIPVKELDFCSDDDFTRGLMRQIMGAIAEYDRKQIIYKLNEARKRCRELGTIEEGRKPFGHRSRPSEAIVVQRIMALADQGNTLQAIASILTQEGIATRYGKSWSVSTIHRIIKRYRAA